MLTPVRIYIDSHILMIYVNDTLSGSQDGYYDIYVCFVICSHSVVKIIILLQQGLPSVQLCFDPQKLAVWELFECSQLHLIFDYLPL